MFVVVGFTEFVIRDISVRKLIQIHTLRQSRKCEGSIDEKIDRRDERQYKRKDIETSFECERKRLCTSTETPKI